MDDFQAIYIILDTLRRALDKGLDRGDLAPKRTGIDAGKRDRLLRMLQEEGYVAGIRFYPLLGGMTGVVIDDLRLTVRGLRYLENDEDMEEARRQLKGL